eukprot:364355-Chlamydomonas_euryale.AAC.12
MRGVSDAGDDNGGGEGRPAVVDRLWAGDGKLPGSRTACWVGCWAVARHVGGAAGQLHSMWGAAGQSHGMWEAAGQLHGMWKSAGQLHGMWGAAGQSHSVWEAAGQSHSVWEATRQSRGM